MVSQLEADEASCRAALEKVRAQQKLPAEAAAASSYVPVERMVEVLGAEAMSDGVAVNAKGQIFIACNTSFPGCESEMLRWWFTRGCATSNDYMRWHPGDHFSCSWSPGWYEGRSAVDGETHFVSEALGADLGGKAQSIRIQFKPASEYGISTADLEAARVPLAMCARIGVYDFSLGGWLDVGHFIHFTQPVADGFVLKSRFWLGDIDLPDDNWLRLCKGPITAAFNTKFARTFAARVVDGRKSLFHMGLANYRHATEEFSVLATFLADDFQRRAAP